MQPAFGAPLLCFIGCLCIPLEYLLSVSVVQCAVCSVICFRHHHVHGQCTCVGGCTGEDPSVHPPENMDLLNVAWYILYPQMFEENEGKVESVKNYHRREIPSRYVPLAECCMSPGNSCR